MGTESLTQARIDELLTAPKRATNPGARQTVKGRHWQLNYRVEGADGTTFTLYVRQRRDDSDDYSCGLRWEMPSGETATLVRYNGPSHAHRNRLERDILNYRCHVHRATERYLNSGKKVEGFAEESDRYQTVEGALHCLVADCNIDGLRTDPDHPDLFK